jgi:hypothetical protein
MECCRTCAKSELLCRYPSDRNRKCSEGYNPKMNGFCKFKEDILEKTYVDLIHLEFGYEDGEDIIKTKDVSDVYGTIVPVDICYYTWECELSDLGYDYYYELLSK